MTTKKTSGLRGEFQYAIVTASTVYHSCIPFASSNTSCTFRQVAREGPLQIQNHFSLWHRNCTPSSKYHYSVILIYELLNSTSSRVYLRWGIHLFIISRFDLQQTELQKFHNIILIQHCISYDNRLFLEFICRYIFIIYEWERRIREGYMNWKVSHPYLKV